MDPGRRGTLGLAVRALPAQAARRVLAAPPVLAVLAALPAQVVHQARAVPAAAPGTKVPNGDWYPRHAVRRL